MKIVYVSREYGPVTGGGIGTYIGNVCRAMIEQGHDVYLLSDCVSDENSSKFISGLNVVPLNPVSKSLKGGFFSYNHEYSQRVYESLLCLYKKEAFDVAEFAEYCGEGFISIRSKRLKNDFKDAKLVVKCHTPLSLLEHINEEFQFQADTECDIEMEDYCIRHADIVTSPSLSLAEYFKKRIGRNDILQCPYPLYLAFNESEKNWSEQSRKRIRFVGSVQVRKGVDTLIDAAIEILRKDPSFLFEIYGKERNAAFFNRTYTEVLQSKIPEEFKGRILFKGGIDYQEIPKVLHESTICVLPSRWENWANACLEGMAMGCVMLASDSGGMGEMIEHGKSGYHIDPLDSCALAKRILEIHSDVDLLRTISKSGIARARVLTEPTSITERIISNYRSECALSSICLESTPLVSVVIPFYNQVSTIRETIESVRQSDYSNVEVILVNDGSTSPAATRFFETLDDPFIRKVNKANGGLSSARNVGIEASSGEFFLPLDSDDCIDPSYIGKAVEALLRNPDLGYVSCYTKNFGAFESAYNPVGNVDTLMPFLNTNGKCTNLYRRTVFDQIGGYDENMNSYEDWDYLLTLNDNDIEGDVIPEILFHYRRNYGSMVFSVANHMRANLIQYMLKKHQAFLKKHSVKMIQILSRLWKDTEIREENAVSDRFQTYWALNYAFSEPNSNVMVYSNNNDSDKLGLFEVNLPFDIDFDTIRVDPCSRKGMIHFGFIRIINLEDETVVFESNKKNSFKGIEIAGTAKILSEVENGLLIASDGDDPQILITAPTILGIECRLQISFSVSSLN